MNLFLMIMKHSMFVSQKFLKRMAQSCMVVCWMIQGKGYTWHTCISWNIQNGFKIVTKLLRPILSNAKWTINLLQLYSVTRNGLQKLLSLSTPFPFFLFQILNEHQNFIHKILYYRKSSINFYFLSVHFFLRWFTPAEVRL